MSMRINRKTNQAEIDLKKNILRSTSSFQGSLKSDLPKVSKISRNNLTPTLGGNRSEESCEKNSLTDTFSLESTVFCKYCMAPRDFEIKIKLALEDISASLNSIISAYHNWKGFQHSKFSAKLFFRNIFPNDSEINNKLVDLHVLCNKIQDLIGSLTQDVAVLSKTSAWKNASIRKPAQSCISTAVQDTIIQAQQRLNWLKSNTSLKIFENTDDDFARCLQLELQQSFRDRRILETKLMATGNQTPDNIVKIIERIIKEDEINT